jgi:hypothetical protein
MLPIFPNFKKIARGDRHQVLNYTKQFLPYSDYNFNSLWAWNTTDALQISTLNNNLVVKMPNYLTGENVISFLGLNEVKQTISSLLDYASEHTINGGLTLVPEIVISGFRDSTFHIKEDRDNFDYIFSTNQLAMLQGKSYKTKRHLTKRFITNYPEAKFVVNTLSESIAQKKILSVLSNWQDKQAGKLETTLEHTAIKRLLQLAEADNNELILSGVYLETELLAFSIDEKLSNGYALSHFYKIKNEFKGVSEFLNQNTARFLANAGVEFWNWEQDLGIAGMRRSKLSYRPVQYFKKYKISAP